METYEENGYHDSDFYAVVWDDETESIIHKQYATTRFYSNGYGAKVDATPEVIAKATAERKSRFLKSAIEADEETAKTVAKGKMVEINRGRKNRGVIGEVFWVGNARSFLITQKSIVQLESSWTTKRMTTESLRMLFLLTTTTAMLSTTSPT